MVVYDGYALGIAGCVSLCRVALQQIARDALEESDEDVVMLETSEHPTIPTIHLVCLTLHPSFE